MVVGDVVFVELELIDCWNCWKKPQLLRKLDADVDEVEKSF